MFRKILAKLKNLTTDQPAFDPATLYDPVAMQTNWTPVKSGGSNFQTHKLVMIDPNRQEFMATTGAKLFYIIFILIGAGLLIGFPVAIIISANISLELATLMPAFIGLVFLIAGISLYYFGTSPCVFDKRQGYFWKGRKSPNEVLNKNKLKAFADLKKIHALQIISEYCRSDKNSYYSYELNLVLRDGKRVNVIDHGNYEKLIDDARMLASFLGKPVWDAS